MSFDPESNTASHLDWVA